ncbi:DUF977 family protein, partial [Shigella dysenteriae]|uniref:DUF977 family protein n=1 Tax=Shigella dysenteriae TaxID=622 RepID=UPI000E5D19CB
LMPFYFRKECPLNSGYLIPDGEIRRYDRRHNIICTECRKSEVMQRVLAFYQGNFQEVVL